MDQPALTQQQNRRQYAYWTEEKISRRLEQELKVPNVAQIIEMNERLIKNIPKIELTRPKRRKTNENG